MELCEIILLRKENTPILGSSNKSKYMVINSERLKNVFLKIENSFKYVNYFEQRMKL